MSTATVDDFASALLHPETDISAWTADEVAAHDERALWPRRHDFEKGRLKTAPAEHFRLAERRIQETGRVVAARMLILYQDKAVNVLGLEFLEAALAGQALLNGSVVNAIADMAGPEWAKLITRAALGPGRTQFKIGDADYEAAQAFLEAYISSMYEEDRQAHAAMNDPCAELLRFAEEHGRCPIGSERPDLHLWCAEQRRKFRRGLLTDDEASLLSGLPGWAWYFPGGNNQELGLLRVLEFVDLCTARGTSYVPFDTKLSNGQFAADWLRDRRWAHAKGKMAPAIIQLLETLPDWTWDHEYWQEGLALIELNEYTNKNGSAAGCRDVCALSRVAGILAKKWYHGASPIRGVDVLDEIPGWEWEVTHHARDTIRCAVLALRLNHARLTEMQQDITVSRILAAEPETLGEIGTRYGMSREAVRQHEAALTAKVNHPCILRTVQQALSHIKYSDELAEEVIRSREQAAIIAALRPEASVSHTFVERVISEVLGRQLVPGSLARAKRCSYSGLGAESFATLLGGSDAAARALIRRGAATIGDIAQLDEEQVPRWRYIRRSCVPAVQHMIREARALTQYFPTGSQPHLLSTPAAEEAAFNASSVLMLNPSTRTRNILLRHGVVDFALLGHLDLEAAASWPGVGVGVLNELVQMRTAIQALAAQRLACISAPSCADAQEDQQVLPEQVA
jgi:hypothetical protein